MSHTVATDLSPLRLIQGRSARRVNWSSHEDVLDARLLVVDEVKLEISPVAAGNGDDGVESA